MLVCKRIARSAQWARNHTSRSFLYHVHCRDDGNPKLLNQTPVMRRTVSSSTSITNQHNSLATFFEYASATALSRSSTVFVGTLYEYQCQESLRRLGFSLERTGGSGDAGVDLAGIWNLPSSSSNSIGLQVIVQCKALNRKTGPSMMRELEGTLAAHREETVGVLCSTKTATKGVRDVLRNSKSPMVWLQIEQIDAPNRNDADHDNDSAPASKDQALGVSSEVRIRQMLWNEQVERIGASGMSITLLRGNPESSVEGGQIALLWNGEIWTPV